MSVLIDARGRRFSVGGRAPGTVSICRHCDGTVMFCDLGELGVVACDPPLVPGPEGVGLVGVPHSDRCPNVEQPR